MAINRCKILTSEVPTSCVEHRNSKFFYHVPVIPNFGNENSNIALHPSFMSLDGILLRERDIQELSESAMERINT